MSSRRPKGASKSEIMTHLAEKTGLAKSQVSGVFDAFGEFVAKELRAGRPVTIPGLAKITVVHKAAKPARPGRNPATGETIMLKAKPASKAVKVRAIKALKDMV